MAKERATLEEAERAAGNLGKELAKEMPKGWGFTILLTSFGENSLLTYISNCDRSDMIESMKEFIHNLENGKNEL